MTQTLEVDIPQYAGMNVSTSRKLAKLLSILSGSAPYKPNMGNLAVELSVSKNDLPDYLANIEKAGLIGQLREQAGGSRNLGKVEKVFLDNPNLMYALKGSDTNIGSVRKTFFYNQMRVNNDITSSKITDFRIGQYLFEVGGAAKSKRQLQGDPKGIVGRDDIESDILILSLCGDLVSTIDPTDDEQRQISENTKQPGPDRPPRPLPS